MEAILPKPGIFIVAVSGGVDSMTLLHLLNLEVHKNDKTKLIVAHLDHGIRPDSSLDRKHVQDVSSKLDIPFVYHESKLGAGASEDEARKARYGFLNKVKDSSNATAIVTAHHQDDQIETAIINIIRGSGRKGLTSLKSTDQLLRPLLNYSKKDIINYAKKNNIKWIEDSSNADTKYLRNYIRHQIIPKFDNESRQKFITLLGKQAVVNSELDDLFNLLLNQQDIPGTLDRDWFILLPHNTAKEILASWLRNNNIRTFDKKTLERLVVSGKTARPGLIFPISGARSLKINKNNLALV